MIDFEDYAELRRRAEKRLTVLSPWPLILFQGAAYALMMIRSPLDMGIVMLSFMGAAGITAITFFVYRRSTAANRKARRKGIDAALDEMVDSGWPIEEPTARDLRLLALVMDEDMETRAGMGRVVVWSAAAAVLGWVLTYAVAGTLMYQYGGMFGPYTLVYPFLFMVWLALYWAFSFMHRRQRLQSEERAGMILRRSAGRFTGKPKRAAEAPWWSNDGELEPDSSGEKPKRLALDDLPPDDDDWTEGDAGLYSRR